jgi:hypothetical protein
MTAAPVSSQLVSIPRIYAGLSDFCMITFTAGLPPHQAKAVELRG